MSHPVLELQSADTNADQLRHRRDHLPERAVLVKAQAALSGWERQRQQLHARLDQLAADVASEEAESHEIDKHRDRLQRQLRTVIAPREAEALQHEIQILNDRRSALDDAELAALEEQTMLEDELVTLLEQHDVLAAAVEAAATAVEAAELEITRELEAYAATQAALRAAVEQGTLGRYDNLRKHHLVAASMLKGHRCEGCHMDLSAHEVDDVKEAIAAGGLSECPQCGRLLII
jgi:predicted  nucleic acid-binding Zn-ribbon protein